METKGAVVSLLSGIILGAICVFGLKGGLGFLLKAQEANDSSLRTKYFLGATLLLVGQLVAALGFLFFFRPSSGNPMALGVGLMSSTFVFSLLGRRFS